METTTTRQSIFSPVWRSAIDQAATRKQTSEWDVKRPASSLR